MSSLTNPAPREPAGADAMSARGAAPAPGAASALPVATPEEIYARSLAELKDRFSTFYVSTIVGKQAILRRSLGGPRGGVLASTPPSPTPSGAAGAPIALAGTQLLATGAPSGRSDTLMLSDGELLDSVGSSGALLTKINSRQVTIYLVQETFPCQTASCSASARSSSPAKSRIPEALRCLQSCSNVSIRLTSA